MTLPLEILYIRLRNELEACQQYLPDAFDLSERSLTTFPLKVEVSLDRTPGPVMENGKVTYRYNHRLELIIGREYPFEKPLVIWKTPILAERMKPILFPVALTILSARCLAFSVALASISTFSSSSLV